MSVLVGLLMLAGLVLVPATEAAVMVDMWPELWAEPESLREPWANLTLLCRALLGTTDFQLFKDGALLEQVRLQMPALEHRFLIGAVAQGPVRFRCRSGLSKRWTSLSDLLEVAGPGSLAPPSLSAPEVAWITPQRNCTLLCRAGLRGVTFLLRREGDDQFLATAEAVDAREATFPVHQAGNYSCSYRTHAEGAASEPSAAVTVQWRAVPPPPTLNENSHRVVLSKHSGGLRLECVAPLQGVDFRLQLGEEPVESFASSTTPGRVFFHVPVPGAQLSGGLYTCRYRLGGEGGAWSEDSAPVEVLLSDETLPAPHFSAEPATPSPARGALVRLRCEAPRGGLRFVLLHKEEGVSHVQAVLSPAGAVADFQLPNVSVADSGNYSCVYLDPATAGTGSAPSAPLELRLDGLAPAPQLQALWSGAVAAGTDAILRCQGPVPGVVFELLREGKVEASVYSAVDSATADLVLPFVGPQHAGGYSCRYGGPWSRTFLSEPSAQVQLQVAG